MAGTLELLKNRAQPGVTTAELDRTAETFIRDNGGEPSFLGYLGYPATVCISVNEEVVHGIPGNRVIQDGDIVGIDAGVVKDGYHGDAAITFPVGNIPDDFGNQKRVAEAFNFQI